MIMTGFFLTKHIFFTQFKETLLILNYLFSFFKHSISLLCLVSKFYQDWYVLLHLECKIISQLIQQNYTSCHFESFCLVVSRSEFDVLSTAVRRGNRWLDLDDDDNEEDDDDAEDDED